MRDNLTKSILIFDYYGFQRVEDEISSYSKDAILHYRHIKLNTYLVFNHYNPNKKPKLQGFDFWKVKYAKESDIGKVKPIEIESLMLSFDFEKDIDLLNNQMK